MVMSISNLIENINANYDKSNEEPIRYLKRKFTTRRYNDLFRYGKWWSKEQQK